MQAAPAPKPIVPAAANSIAANPDRFYGETVTVTARVAEVLSGTSFTVAQASGGAVLVTASHLTAAVTVASELTVIGEVIKHDGRPAIRASAVLTAAGVDIAKPVPPPLTPDEAAFDKTMKGIGPAFNAVRTAVGAGGREEAARHAATLVQGFAETEAFWKKAGKADAQKWAAEARAHAASLERAIAAAKFDEAKTAVDALQRSCSACHGAYRERLDDGSYRIRGN